MAAVEHSTGDPTNRSRTRASLIEVASALLAERGAEAVTTRAVATAAGVAAPTLYRLFGDKEGLLDAVAEHAYGRYAADKAVDEQSDPLDDFRAGWDLHIGFRLANPGVSALMADPRRASRSRAAAIGREVLFARVRRLAAAGRLRTSERRAAELTHAAGTGVVLTLLALPPHDRDLGLADATYQAVVNAIVVDVAPTDEPGPATAAAALRMSAAYLPMLTSSERQLLIEWLDRITRARGTA